VWEGSGTASNDEYGLPAPKSSPLSVNQEDQTRPPRKVPEPRTRRNRLRRAAPRCPLEGVTPQAARGCFFYPGRFIWQLVGVLEM